jgi:hypothetical protein
MAVFLFVFDQQNETFEAKTLWHDAPSCIVAELNYKPHPVVAEPSYKQIFYFLAKRFSLQDKSGTFIYVMNAQNLVGR